MKKFIFLVIILALITIFIPTSNDAQAASLDYNVKVMMNDKLVEFPDQKPFVDNNASRTFVPLRFVSEALGCEVDWDSNAQTAIVEREGTYIEMIIGSAKPLVNDQTKTLDAPARLENQRTMVPLRFVSEALGEYVDWDGKTRTVYISDVPREVTEPVEDNDTESDNDTGWTIIKPRDGGGGPDTTPVDDTPWTPVVE